MTLNSETAAYVIVYLDFCIVLSMWIGMIYLKPVIKLTEEEIEDSLVNAVDFTVQIVCQEDRSMTVDEKRASYWNWAQNLMKNDPKNLKSPIDNMPDDNQNEISAVEIGMSNLDYMPVLK